MTVMTERDHRRDERARRRGELSGSGPVRDEGEIARNPGATAKFALFGEVLLIGLLVGLISLPIVTLPAALAAGAAHLRRFARADDSALRLFWSDLRTALPGGALVGLGATVLAALLALDVALANSGLLPGGPIIAGVGVAGLVALGTALLIAAGRWSAEGGWRGALRSVPASVTADPIGGGYLAAAVVMTGVVTWMLAPLLIPALGCAAFAAFAVPERPRRR